MLEGGVLPEGANAKKIGAASLVVGDHIAPDWEARLCLPNGRIMN